MPAKSRAISGRGRERLRFALGVAGLGLGGGALGGLLEPEAVALDGEDLGSVQEPVDESDDAGGVGEDLGPLGEGLVGAQDDRARSLVATGDDLEEEVGVAAVVGEVADLIDAQELGLAVAA